MAIKIPNKLVKEDNGYGRTINQLMDIFVLKEMGKRQIKKEGFNAAVVEIFDDGRDPKTHLNEEAKFVLTYKDKAPTERGPIKVRLEELRDIEWHEEELDPNSAKFFIVRWSKDYWILNFDFRYNKAIAKEKIERAKEFLSATEKLQPQTHINVMVYLLWSCAELIVDCKLYLMPRQKPRMEHKDRKEKLETFGKTSNIFSSKFIIAFRSVSNNKNNARYGGNVEKNIDKKFIRDTVDVLRDEINLMRI